MKILYESPRFSEAENVKATVDWMGYHVLSAAAFPGQVLCHT